MTDATSVAADQLRSIIERQIKTVPVDRLLQILRYEEDTGHLYWVVTRSNRAKADSIAGSLTFNGYLEVGIDNVSYPAHRIAWAMHFGECAPEFLDHINGIRTDNRIVNLRLATAAQNARNVRMHKDNRTGLKGVIFHRDRLKPWQARIFNNGRCNSLGYFFSKEEAHEAYARAAEKHFGEFARAS